MESQGNGQHSQHGPSNDNSRMSKSMREYMHPQQIGVRSCIVLPNEPIVIKPHLVPLLPQFHGMDNDNPYSHIKDFEEVCHTFHEGNASIELMRLKLFPFTLKDKAKLWFNSLRPQSIRSWSELQAAFLKKYFPAHRTSGLKRQITNFAALDNEKFYTCWERYLEVVNACPHHGFDTWMLVNYFYEGMSSTMKQLLETMCGGNFMSQSPDEAFEFLSYVAETSRSWDEPHGKDSHKFNSQSNSNGGMYVINEEVEVQAKMEALTRRLEKLEAKGTYEVNAIYDNPIYMEQCSICQSMEHQVSDCPSIPAMRETFVENHSHMSWNHGQEQFPSSQCSQGQQFMQNSPQKASLVEQAIINLSKVVGDFIGEQKNINTQVNKRIDYIETSLTQKLDSMEADVNQKLDNIQLAISRFSDIHSIQEKWIGPQSQHDIRGKHEACGSSIKEDEVKAAITLRSGKELEQPKANVKKNEKGEQEKEKLKIEDNEKSEGTKAESFEEEKKEENEEFMEAYLIESSMEEPMKNMVEENFAKLGERTKIWRINEDIQFWKLKARAKMKQLFGLKKVAKMKHDMHNNSQAIKKKMKEWHDRPMKKTKFKEVYYKPHPFPRKLKYQGLGPFIVCMPYVDPLCKTRRTSTFLNLHWNNQKGSMRA